MTTPNKQQRELCQYFLRAQHINNKMTALQYVLWLRVYARAIQVTDYGLWEMDTVSGWVETTIEYGDGEESGLSLHHNGEVPYPTWMPEKWVQAVTTESAQKSRSWLDNVHPQQEVNQYSFSKWLLHTAREIECGVELDPFGWNGVETLGNWAGDLEKR